MAERIVAFAQAGKLELKAVLRAAELTSLNSNQRFLKPLALGVEREAR